MRLARPHVLDHSEGKPLTISSPPIVPRVFPQEENVATPLASSTSNA
jgi:hypothetical protein